MGVRKSQRTALLVGAAVFLLGGIDAIENGDLVAGLPSLIAGALNLWMARTVASAKSLRTTFWIQIVNAAMAAVMAVATLLAGKQYLPFAWGLAALVFLVLIARSRKAR